MSTTHRYSLTARLVLDFAATRVQESVASLPRDSPATPTTARQLEVRAYGISFTRLRTGLLTFRREAYGAPVSRPGSRTR